MKKFNATNGPATKWRINEYMRGLSGEIEKIITNNAELAAKMPADLHAFILSQAAANLSDGTINSKTFNRMFGSIPKEAVSNILDGGLYVDGKGLSQRIWSNTVAIGNNINEIVASGLSRQISAKELAKLVQGYVDPTQYKDWSKRASELLGKGYGKIEYNSLRLARTTITHAGTLADKLAAKRNPFCEGLKWNLSGSHSTRMHGHTDECDSYAGRVFPVDDYPFEHPNGLCYPTPAILKSIDEIGDELKNWVNGEDNPRLDSWYANNFTNDEVAVGKDISMKAKFDYNAYSKISKNDVEREVSAFYSSLSQQEQSAIRRYVANGNSFRLNEHLYTGKYEQEKASILNPEQTMAKLIAHQDMMREVEGKLGALSRQMKAPTTTDEMKSEIKKLAIQLRKQQRNLEIEIESLANASHGLSKYTQEIDNFSEVIKKGTIPEKMQVVRNVDTNVMNYILKQANLEVTDIIEEGLVNLQYHASIEEVTALADELNSNLSGVIYKNHSFISTSYNATENVFQDRAVQMEFFIDEGTPALITDNWRESEIVFDKFANIEILGFTSKTVGYDGGKNILVMQARIIK